jgi:hypothetical protein
VTYRATFTPQDFPSPALLLPYSGTHNSNGEWECRESPRETLLAAVPQRAPVIALHLARTVGSIFF